MRGYPLEDEFVFKNHFSTHGSPPYLRNGTFLELGAHDGVTVSNTLWLEKALGWSGVLIEASTNAFKALKRKRSGPRNTLRNAVVCPHGKTVQYLEPRQTSDVVMAGIGDTMPARNKKYAPNRKAVVRELRCEPLSAILHSAGVRYVDYFSLDVEGAELTVLQTIDWMAVTFGVIMVEQDGKAPLKDEGVRQVLRAHGYSYETSTGAFCRAEVWRATKALA